MTKKDITGILRDFEVSYICETQNITVSGSRYSLNRTPLDIITGETPNIFEYLDFGIYNWVIFWRNSGVRPPELGIWLHKSPLIFHIVYFPLLAKLCQVLESRDLFGDIFSSL